MPMPSYLFLRPDSRNWHVRFRYPDRVVEKSLGTPDRKRAEILALPHIAHHKETLLAAKPRIESAWRYEYEPGTLHAGPNGERIAASESELKFYGHDGRLIRTTPNGASAFQIVNLQQRLGIPVPVPLEVVPDNNTEGAARPVLQTKTADDAILETYIKHRKITGYNEREARDVWMLFKTLTNNKPLKHCDRDDGRKLVTHFEDQELATKTIEKKIAWLNAAVNLAIEEGRHKSINPFSSIIPEDKDAKKRRRLPLSDADIKAIKRGLDQLDKADQLLVRLLASTGMRIGEAFEIDGEEKERGCRYVTVGTKTQQSLRRVPLPAALLPWLPKKITGPLFDRTNLKDPSDAASKRLNRFLDDCGIDDKRKVVHSLRHRAADRLRAFECPPDIRYAILGHEDDSVAEDYGVGFSVPKLKKWIDKIGF
jgi:integrase